MPLTEEGHEPNRAYLDALGNFHPNGSNTYMNSVDAVTCTASTLTVTQLLHDGKTITLDRAAGIAVTLPASTGSRMKLRFEVKTAVSGGSHVITAAGAHLFGHAWAISDNSAAVLGYHANGSTVITLDGSTQGGYAGHIIELEDLATGHWAVISMGKATGTEATPFS